MPVGWSCLEDISLKKGIYIKVLRANFDTYGPCLVYPYGFASYLLKPFKCLFVRKAEEISFA